MQSVNLVILSAMDNKIMADPRFGNGIGVQSFLITRDKIIQRPQVDEIKIILRDTNGMVEIKII